LQLPCSAYRARPSLVWVVEREAAVIGTPDAYRGETVLAFVSAQPDAEIDVTALSGHCRKQLAAYKCPTEIRVVPDLPKTITGKIKRNALRDDTHSP
jgi:long-chain acyl-CoA synthetase